MPIRSDARGNLIKRSQYKKKKYKYRFTCGREDVYGHTDNPRRTLESIWRVYKHCRKFICVDLGKGKKSEEICIREDDNRQVTYTFKEEEITKHKFKQIIDEH